MAKSRNRRHAHQVQPLGNPEKHHLQSNFLLYYTEKELNKALVFDYNIEEFYKAKFIQQVLGSNYFSEELKESVIKNWVHNLGI